jgi:glucosamine 6-phosphate synthetase-like amidotransferase/phosphosugar isomerase protein
LFIASEHRGDDATGFVAQTEPLDDPLKGRIVVAKEPLPAGTFVEIDPAFRRLRHQRCSAVVGHVRAATHGDPADNRNNHPFVSRDRRLYLAHNGIVTNHRELADKYALKLDSDCDSEVLLRMVAASTDPAAGLRTCLREVQGSMAVAVYDRQREVVWLARNAGRPLWLARLRDDRRTFFASTADILIDAFRGVLGSHVENKIEMLMPIGENAPLAIRSSGVIIAPNGSVVRSVS